MNLDLNIESHHDLSEKDLLDTKILALIVEVGELANETRCFKYWSNKPSSNKETIIEEFVDGLHFILSIGLEIGLKSLELSKHDAGNNNLVNQFLEVYASIHKFNMSKTNSNYQELFKNYFYLGGLLGFTNEDIYEAYVRKNNVNFNRQKEGY
jgi:dimeric dUTPase (all-alpha-NTP-PPase superfamily)